MDLADHFRVVRANWWKILLAAVVVGALSYVYSARQPKVYSTNQLLSVASQDVIGGGSVDPSKIDFRASFYAAIGNSSTIAKAARTDAVKLDPKLADLSADTIQGDINVSTTDTSGFLLLSANGRSAGEAVTLAKATSSALSQFILNLQQDQQNQSRNALTAQKQRLQTALDGLTGGSSNPAYADVQALLNQTTAALITLQQTSPLGIESVTVPITPTTPVSPRPKKAGLLGFLVALVLVGEGTVIARAFSDRFARANDVEQITSFTGLPVLAMVPRGRGPEVVEAFRTLRTNLMFLEGAGRPRTIAIVSPNPGAGKSFSAVHLAESAVAVDAAVVLIDADLRRPVLHSRLRVDREPGLSNALRGADLQTTLHRVDGIQNLKLIPSGSAVNDTVGVLGGRAFRHVLDSLDSAELIVVDTPPGAVYADALAVAAQCDATLLVLDAKSTRRRAARTLIDSLERTGATLIGVVVNNASVDRRDTYERG